ncbi:hypothetical protein CRG98_043355 [Punica granatum]|uniref:RCD1 WWE domain-containing protein n=1 Tax=Punica granatum TaxID=22663 RepID=A0A2I0HXA3_PUNGR|nr:hypothetical protein CRG98_043355 [Punica granatum]
MDKGKAAVDHTSASSSRAGSSSVFYFQPRPYDNFFQTNPPSQILYYDKKQILSYCGLGCPAALNCGRFEMSLGDENFLLDFFAMIFYNFKTGSIKPIAWIDMNGCYFFPYYDFITSFMPWNINPSEPSQGQARPLMDYSYMRTVFLVEMRKHADVEILNIWPMVGEVANV